ncbi:GNAT family N-acetyltransferase [Robiginitalea sediminis]|uniref:GNAT family N-acetyltransferase n=1 Tax=Robiginitalea sediminis TaxID=1982593 RepID=UPI000B4A678B|nr:GNAT family N-acetyltransferase [Robiginitalea sediminis]
MIQIEPAQDNVAFQTIARLADRIWREHYIPIIGKPQVDYMLEKYQSVPAIAAQVAGGMGYYLVRADGEPAGYLAFEKREGHLFLSKIYVAQEFRGKGLGRHAMDFVRARAAAWGCSHIALTVNKDNTESIRAYLRMGFEQGPGTITDIGDGFIMDDYLMTLTLG